MAGDLFHFDETRPGFEDLGQENGATHWSEGILRDALGYRGDATFRKVIERAMQACISLGIAPYENFMHQDGEYCLTRFACYLVAMNGDPKKREVAAAQVYFAAVAETFQTHLEHVEGIERVLIRDEVTDGQRSLASTAKSHGVACYQFFHDAGYRGMYNMSLKRLMVFKGIGAKEKFLDRIGKDELAANLFRITQTETKIKKDGVCGQRALEETARTVGAKVRSTMQDISGTSPEHLPPAENIKTVKRQIKGTRKTLSKNKPSKR